MKNRLCCSLGRRLRATNRRLVLAVGVFGCMFVSIPGAFAGSDAPQWMHAAASAPLPAYDEKTDAVLLFSETDVVVVSSDKIITHVREAYKILRPGGRDRGIVHIYFNPERKIKSIHGWCIPAQGKDYEVKEKDAIEVSTDTEGGELISDAKNEILRIPASDPGNIVGYEYEVEERPFYLQDIWYFQEADPVRESHYSLQLPQGWEFKASWLNHADVKPTGGNGNFWQWTVTDVKEIRDEPLMPPLLGVAGQMIVSFFTTGSPALNTNADWQMMGKWDFNLVGERVNASPEIKQEVSTLSASKTTSLQKMQAVAQFVQHDIRYVQIYFGIGGL